jgi:hypothetical protein
MVSSSRHRPTIYGPGVPPHTRPASLSQWIETSVTFLCYAVLAGGGLRSVGPQPNQERVLYPAHRPRFTGRGLPIFPGPHSRATKRAESTSGAERRTVLNPSILLRFRCKVGGLLGRWLQSGLAPRDASRVSPHFTPPVVGVLEQGPRPILC